MRYTAGFQGIQVGQTKLQRVVAKNISHHSLKLRFLPVQEILAGRCFKPILQDYFSIGCDAYFAIFLFPLFLLFAFTGTA